MATLAGTAIADTYDSLLHVEDNTAGLVATSTDSRVIQDGVGANSALALATDSIRITSTNKLYFNDVGGEYISGNGSILSIVGGSEIDLTATAIDINGTADVSGTLTIGGNIDFNSGTIDLSTQTVDVTLNAAADALNFDSNTLSIDASNNRIGIGTASPDYMLDIEATTAKMRVYSTGANDSQLIQKNSNCEWVQYVSSSTGNWKLKDTTSGTYPITIEKNPASHQLYLEATGNLGLQMANPTAKLHMSNSDANLGTMFKIQGTNASMNAASVFIDLDCTTDADVSNLYFAVFQDSDGHIGSIRCSSASAIAFNTSSDYRLKENLSSITDALTRINQLNPVKFNFKKDSAKIVYDGLIAHEIQAVLPYAVTGDKDAMTKKVIADDDGEVEKDVIDPQMIDYGKLTPILIAAVQELSASNDALKARIEVLEAA